MHPLRLLLDELPELLVERRPLPRPGDPPAGLSLAHRQPRRSHRRAPRRARRLVPRLPLPHHHELHPDVPEEPESGAGDWRDKDAVDGAAVGGAVLYRERRMCGPNPISELLKIVQEPTVDTRLVTLLF